MRSNSSRCERCCSILSLFNCLNVTGCPLMVCDTSAGQAHPQYSAADLVITVVIRLLSSRNLVLMLHHVIIQLPPLADLPLCSSGFAFTRPAPSVQLFALCFLALRHKPRHNLRALGASGAIKVVLHLRHGLPLDAGLITQRALQVCAAEGVSKS